MLILERFVRCARVSVTLTIQALLYTCFLHLFSFFGIQTLMFHLRVDAERALAWITGVRLSPLC